MTHNNTFGVNITLTSKTGLAVMSVIVSLVFGLMYVINPNHTVVSTLLFGLGVYYVFIRVRGRDMMLDEYETVEDISDSAYDEYNLHSIVDALPQTISRPTIYKASYDLSEGEDVDEQPVNAKVGTDVNGWYIIVTDGLLEQENGVVNQIIAHEFGHISYKLQHAYSLYKTEVMFAFFSSLIVLTVAYSVSFAVLVVGLIGYMLAESFITQYEEVYCDLFAREVGEPDSSIGLDVMKTHSDEMGVSRNRIINTHPPVENRIKYFNQLQVDNINFFTVIKESIVTDFYIRDPQ